MLSYCMKIGLVPIRRDVTPRPGIFNWEHAEKRCHEAVEYIKKHFTDEHVSFVDIDGINEVNVLYNEKDVEPIVKRFKQEGVDAIFLINGNFGNEEVAGMVSKALKKPVLLWGPQDDSYEEDGTRYTDTQCGLFGTSRQLQRLNIPFTYIENCFIEEPIFEQGFRKFISTVCMVKNFSGLRIAQVGMRPKPFCSVIFNEGELLQKFGIQVIPVNLAVIKEKYEQIMKERTEELKKGAEKIKEMYDLDEPTMDALDKIYAFVLLYQEIFEEYWVDAVSAECWCAMQLLVGAMPCMAYGILADMGYIIGCESDLHATITQILLSSAALGEYKPFLGEFTTRHPEDKNVELLWHCGPFAYSLRKEGEPCKGVNMREWFQVKDGHYTAARFEQDQGNYSILAGECDSDEGPYTFGTYLWARFHNLSNWERKLIEAPYIHHISEIEGGYTDSIREFCKYVPDIRFDTVE